MTRMYKTQLHLATKEQVEFIETCMEVKRQLYNLYLSVQFGLLTTRKRLYPDYEQYKKLPKAVKDQFFISGYSFEKIYNHEIKPATNANPLWNVSPQKNRKQAFLDADTAFKRYFKGLASKPKYKSYYQPKSAYFVGSIHIQRDRIKLAKIGNLRLSEFGYLPTDKHLQRCGKHVTGTWVTKDVNQYYITVMTNEDLPIQPYPSYSQAIGIDLGVKQLATTPTADHINLSKTKYYYHLENYANLWAKRFNRRIAYLKRALGLRKLRGRTSKGIEYARFKMRWWRRKVRCVNENYFRQVVSKIVQTKPRSITIENLNIKGMQKNAKLAPAIQKLGLYKFVVWLKWQCQKHGIELRQVSQWFPSTKVCSNCGQYNQQQFNGSINDLAIRTFRCSNCGSVIDRDKNASLNLAQAKDYQVLI